MSKISKPNVQDFQAQDSHKSKKEKEGGFNRCFLFHNMRSITTIAKHPIIYLINPCTTLKQLNQIHTYFLVNGYLKNPNILGQFVTAISLKTPHYLEYSDQVIQSSETHSCFAFNSMIRAHSKTSSPEKSFHFFNKILRSTTISPDNYTFTFLVRSCAQLLEHGVGRAVHGAVVKYGFDLDKHVQSGLVLMYAGMGCLDSFRQLFESMPEPDIVTRTAMVSACAKCGDVVFARQVFDSMGKRDAIAWSAMIGGYAQCGQSRKALDLFRLMQLEGVKVSEGCMVSVLSACSQLGSLDHGAWADAYIERKNIPMTVILGTALIDMYAKCGNMDKAMAVFWGLKEKNVYAWSTAMNGLAMNGASDKCLELFSLMKKDGVLPNEVTFVSVLRACSIVGSVEEGCRHFVSMKKDHGIEPSHAHYGCMVDLYGRAGRLNEAVNVIYSMPIKPHAGAWGALLNACKLYKNVDLGELASRKLIELEGRNHSAYVLLSNVYADSKNWERVDNVRHNMEASGVRKQPGCSVIEVDGEVHEFFAGDGGSYLRNDDVEVMLEVISRKLRVSDYATNTKPVSFDISAED